VLSKTVTEKLQLGPACVLQVTDVVPTGKNEPEAGEHETVPQPALVVRDGFNYLFRLNGDNRISQLKVQTGRLAGDRVEITSGLAADARIIVSGAGFLNDGDLVRVSDAVPGAPAAASAKPATAASK